MNKTPEMARMEADLSASEALREQLDTAMKRIAEAGEAQSDGEIFEKAAAELGYQITAAELERVSAANEEISPDEMELAAGAGGEDGDGHDNWCLTAWHCHAITLHTTPSKGNEDVACFDNYLCRMMSHYSRSA